MIAKDLEDYKGFFPANPTPVVDGEGIKEDLWMGFSSFRGL